MPDLEAALARLEEIVVSEKEGMGGQDGATSICVIAQTRAMRDAAAQRIASKGVETHVIEANNRDSGNRTAVRFSTMHRAKGLEFDQVVVLAPASMLGAPNETAGERRLLYVSLTRAKRAATVVLF